ncbi:MAG: methylated-DNA--[protein]-cysteine S-methyltransferase [Bifidobacteriaceae bacterium]|jgi:methylated-DNA-[protein]-cysteine S-methyltransferase|nr:methylated-DNA--[protein]-cysteine S-methyltransferase [Bifidobacteriaceae bacterium]
MFNVTAQSPALTLAHTVIDTPIGRLGLFQTEVGLAKVAFEADRVDRLVVEIAQALAARPVHDPARLEGAKRQLDQYFDKLRRVFDLRLDLSLAHGFALDVVKRLNILPYGRTKSYGQLAKELGRPGASRAVGTACGANPLPVVIPCHRVVKADGTLGGYGGGEDIKRTLLELEGVRTP